MKPGDIVVILDNKCFYKYFNVGDKAKLIEEINGGCWWADFTINENYYGDGKWLIGRENFNFKLFEKNKMTHKEILEALLKGKTLIGKDNSELFFENDDLFVLETNGNKCKLSCWFIDGIWKIKQKTISINGFEVPEPVREPLNHGDKYFFVNFLKNIVTEERWLNDIEDNAWLKSGSMHLTKEAAQIHLNAILSFTKQN